MPSRRAFRNPSQQQDIATLRLFNEKVARLAATGFMARYDNANPEVVATCEEATFELVGPTEVVMTARIRSGLPEINLDEIEAFVLTYRMFTQRKDRISLDSLARVYDRPWMPPEATAPFTDARAEVNAYLDSPTSLLDGPEPIHVRHLMKVVIYGGLAHTDPAKEQILRSWMDSGGLAGFVWAEFIVALKRMMHFLNYFSDLNTAVLNNLAEE